MIVRVSSTCVVPLNSASRLTIGFVLGLDLTFAFRGLDALSPDPNIRAWLFAITRRVIADYRKRAFRRREEPSAELHERAHPEAAPQVWKVDASRARAALRDAVGELDDDKRAVFVLHELEELTMHQVVTILNCPLKTGYSRLYAARKLVFTQVRKRMVVAARKADRRESQRSA